MTNRHTHRFVRPIKDEVAYRLLAPGHGEMPAARCRQTWQSTSRVVRVKQIEQQATRFCFQGI